MATGDSVIHLRTRRSYRPDLVSLACARIQAARKLSGLSLAAFAAELEPLLGWAPAADLVRTWETEVAPPGQVVIACEVVSSRPPQPHQGSGDEVAAAVQEAEADQAWLLGDLGQLPVDALWQEAVDLARADNRTPAQAFSASHQLRRHALALADNARRPGALSDLYVIAGQATALMASTAFDLNQWDASATLARSAVSYAAFGGDSSLHAWTRGLAATLANWRNEPSVALSHFGKGMEIAPPGIPKARLEYIAARSYALLGDISSVREVLDQARRDQDDAANHHDVLSHEVAGEFAFGTGRAEACAAAAWLDLDCGREAAAAARRALDSLTTLPVSQQPRSQIMGARIDLASALLMDGDLDAAEDALKLVTATPALKNVSLSGRLARTGAVLASPRWAADPAARRLSSAIAE
jgi:hypothetical protein